MAVSAKVIEDSINPWGSRLTTIEVTMHRFVLAEFNTHRVFSRNSASSRAIPVLKQLDRVEDDPAWPVVWASEQKGMQGGDELTGMDLVDAKELFRDVHDYTVDAIRLYVDMHPDVRLHKSLLNRLLEPFMWHTVIVSSTEWGNFWNQRCSPLAQPEMRAAAEAMRDAYLASEPNYRTVGEYHLPYVTEEERGVLSFEQLLWSSTARCARVSYLNHGADRPYEDEERMTKGLLSASPPHESPLEHVASVTNGQELGNFGDGWRQLRHDTTTRERLK